MEIFRILIPAFITAVSCEISIHGGNYRLHEKHIIKTFTKHTSRLQCGQRCKYNDQCKSYSVNVAIESCVLYNAHGDHDQRRSLISDPLWEFFDARKVLTVEKICTNGNNPCKMGECLSTPTMPWYTCQCHKDVVGQHCDQALLGSETYPAKSCLAIRQQNVNTTSAFYWIAFNGDTFRGFCDMETDEGGWLMIASIGINEPNSFQSYLTDNVLNLANLESGEAVVLGAAGIKLLKEETEAKQLRIYCKKEHTIHIVTKNNTKGYDVINYFSDVTNEVRPAACDSFDKLSDDNSILSNSCGNWYYDTGLWSHPTRVAQSQKLYDHTCFIGGLNHIVFNTLCDDKPGDETSIGIWKYYIR